MRRKAVCVASAILCGCILAGVLRLGNRDSVRYVPAFSLGASGAVGGDRAPETSAPETTRSNASELQPRPGTEAAVPVPASGGGGAVGGRAPEGTGPKVDASSQQPVTEVAVSVPASGGGGAAGGRAPQAGGPEAPGGTQLTVDELRKQPERMFFFIHEDIMAARAELMRCWLFDILGVHETLIDMDEKVGVGMAEHFHEWDILSRFREHPQRTFDVESAHVHIVFMLFTGEKPKCKERVSGNWSLRYLLDETRALPAFKRREKFLISYPSFIKPAPWIREYFNDSKHTNVLEDDLWFGAPRVRCLQVPYVAHRQLDAVAWGNTSSLQEAQVRNITFMFHGKGHRNAEGRNRGILMDMIRGNFSNTSMLDYSFERDRNQTDQLMHVRATAQTYLQSRFCLILPGDTHTTRRMFDAMAAGCVPVVYGNILLPFSETVPWRELVVFIDSCRADRVIETLRELLLLEDVARRGRAAQDAYSRWLSFTRGTGMVSAILREEVEVLSAYGDRMAHFSNVPRGKQCGPETLF